MFYFQSLSQKFRLKILVNMGPDGSDLGHVVSNLFLLYEEELQEVVTSSACVLALYFHAASPQGMTCRAFKLTALKNFVAFYFKKIVSYLNCLDAIFDLRLPSLILKCHLSVLILINSFLLKCSCLILKLIQCSWVQGTETFNWDIDHVTMSKEKKHVYIHVPKKN